MGILYIGKSLSPVLNCDSDNHVSNHSEICGSPDAEKYTDYFCTRLIRVPTLLFPNRTTHLTTVNQSMNISPVCIFVSCCPTDLCLDLIMVTEYRHKND